MSVDGRARSFCNKFPWLVRAWVGGDKVSEVKVAPRWPWQWLGDRQQDCLCQGQNEWLWRSRKVGGLSQVLLIRTCPRVCWELSFRGWWGWRR